jgi:hypothetical protein
MADAVVLIALCAVVVLTAGAMTIGGRMHAKTVMCQQNLRAIGQALNLYAEDYQGKLPTLERGTYTWHYYVLRAENPTGSGIYPWYHLGCVFGHGLINDARTLYCPATKGAMDEYIQYTNPAPWGTMPQMYNYQNQTNQWLRASKGYIYWPQSKDLATQMDVAGYGSGNTLYEVGCPKPATTLAKLDTSKAICSDSVYHFDGGNYKVNGLFWDCSVRYQDVPKSAEGKWLYYQQTTVFGEVVPASSEMRLVTMAKWMWLLQ